MIKNQSISIVIPVFNIGISISKLISKIPVFVDIIYLVDDLCPLKTGKKFQEINNNHKVRFIFNEKNLGVGGAVKRGYIQALKDSIDIIVKIDGDDQMDPEEIIDIINPLFEGYDYTKGNRFLNNQNIENYPQVRMYGNVLLSFMSKLSSGYWDLYDPINGFTAIKAELLKKIELDRVDNGYYFESDMLHNLYFQSSLIKDVSVNIKYFKNKKQNLSIPKETINFFLKNITRCYKRLKITYFTNNFTIASFALLTSLLSLSFSFLYGGYNFLHYSLFLKINAPTGIVMFSSNSLFLSIVFLMLFLFIDSNNNPNNK